MEKEKHNVALLSVFAAVFLTGFKLVIGLFTGSLGILSEALHSALDLVAAVITFLSVRVSDKPADEDHHFGHGKFENLSAFVQTLLLLITCVWIIYEASHRLMTGNTDITVSVWSYIVVITSIVIDWHRSRALMKMAKKHNSQALEADALHFSTDIWSSCVVLIGLVCYSFGIKTADSVAAIGVAIIVLYVCYQLGKRSIDVLLDKAPDGFPLRINRAMRDIPGLSSFHDIKIRAAGADTFVELNIHVDPNLTVKEGHDISHEVEKKIKRIIKRGDVHVHIEPEEEE